MKKLYLLVAAALCAATATAANGDVTDGWLMLEDFEGATPALSTFKPGDFSVGTGTSEVAVYTSKDGNVDNHVGKFTANDARTDGFLLTVTLPDGKTIDKYTEISFDICGITTQFKPLRLFINGTEVTINENNVIADRGKWYSRSYAIPEGVTGSEIKIGFYNHLDGRGDAVAFDNIQLKEKEGGSGENPNPGPNYDASKNGTVTDGWLMIEDYQTKKPGDELAIAAHDGDVSGSAVVEVDPTKGTNLTGKFTGGNYKTLFSLNVTLPDGKTLKNYSTIAFDIYRNDGDADYKKMHVIADGEDIYYDPDFYQQANAKTWTTKEYSIESTVAAGNTFTLRLGIESNGANYLIDNVRLKEREEIINPGTYDETKNGTVTDGWLMIEDYQTKKPGDEATVGNYYGGEATGMSAEIVVDPTKATNLVASAKQTNSSWNNLFALDVVLPEGTTLKDYSAIAFDIYRFTAPEGDRPIFVKAGNYEIKPDNPFEQIKTEEWITKEYAISENTQEGNSFKLYFGIKSDNVNYAVDNIRLKAKETPKPELEVVGTPVMNVKHRTAAGIITVSYSFEVKNYNGEEINVVATVDGHNEVIFEAAEPNNAPARAAGENTTFSGNLKAQHDVLKTINPNVRLTATAGEKQLFDITKAPDTTTGIEDVTVDSEAPVEYFNLQGLRVAQPEAGQLYIKRQGDKAVKVRF